jgi:aminoglycoside phosphotransferase (APT) family kinase protein
MHPDELDVPVDVAVRLVAEQFPQWRDRPLRRVVSTGTVNAVFRVGEDVAARFPLRAQDPDEARALLAAEVSAMGELAACCPVATPTPLSVGAPGQGYPLPWLVQTWLPGRDAAVDDASGSVLLGEDLARLVAALRAAPTHGRTFAGSGRGGDLRRHDAWMDECLRRSEGLLDVDEVRRLWAVFRDLPRAGQDVMAHGDLMAPNVLVDGGRLVGVLDGGGFAPADPALDLVAAWHLLETGPREVFRRSLGSDDVEWARGRAWALQQSMGLVWYYERSNPVMSSLGRRALERILADPGR